METLADNTVTTRIPPQLIESDIHGKGAAEIGWGSPGDFDRCRRFAATHGIPRHMRDGFCANLHKLATGEWPGRNAHKGAHALDYLIAAMGPAFKGRPWSGPLAPINKATGDGRIFPAKTLQYQSFPMPLGWQEHSSRGHDGAVTVGVIEHAEERVHNGVPIIWGRGYLLDPDIIPDVRKAEHLIEHGVAGASVDLDSYTAALRPGEDGKHLQHLKEGRIRSATVVRIPAFADLRLQFDDQETVTASVGTVDTVEEFTVNSSGWKGAPVAPREALFDADDAVSRIEAWAGEDAEQLGKMFLWINPDGQALGRDGYKLPWGDIVDGKPYLIYHAIYAAAALLSGAHGGLPNIPDPDKAKLRGVITQIYSHLAQELNDPNIRAPWDRRPENEQVTEAAVEDGQEFAGRYTEAKHPRKPKKVPRGEGGEWVDVPGHGPHGQILKGGKYVYPPKAKPGGKTTVAKAHRDRRSDEDVAARGREMKRETGSQRHPLAEDGDDTRKPAKKAPAAKKAPVKRAPTAEKKKAPVGKDDADRRNDLAEELADIQADIDRDNEESDTGGIMTRDQREDLDDRARQLREQMADIDNRGRSGKTTVAKKVPAKKANAKTVVAKKEHKLTDAQQRALEARQADPDAKIHPGTRKVLEREGFLDSDGKLTRKSLTHLGSGRGEKAAGKKPAGKTIVVKKAHKVTPAQQRALDALEKDPDAKIHPATRKVLEREGLIKARSERKKEAATEKVPAKKVATVVKKGPERAEVTKKQDRERNAGHVAFLKTTFDRSAAADRLQSLGKQDLLDVAKQLKIESFNEKAVTADSLRITLESWVNDRVYRDQRKLRHDAGIMVRDLRAEHQRLLSAERRRGQVPSSGRSNPSTLSDGMTGWVGDGSHWWDQLHEDTGPQGIPVKNLTIAEGVPFLDIPAYRITSGRAFRFNGVSYLVEDGAGQFPPHIMAEQLRRFQDSLPPSASRYQRGFVIAKGANPADAYWQRKYKSPGHQSIASAGDGATRIWSPGFTGGKVPADDEELFGHLRHEFGHNVGKSETAKLENVDDGSLRWKSAGELDAAGQRHELQGVQWDVPSGSFPPEQVSEHSRDYPHGVSRYGKSSQSEDYAESTYMYLSGPIGTVIRDGKVVPIFFRDVWPHRAELLDKLYPDVAKIQEKLLTKRGAISS